MDSRLSGIERFIIFLGVRKILFYFFFFLTLKKIMNRSIPLRRESIIFLGVSIRCEYFMRENFRREIRREKVG